MRATCAECGREVNARVPAAGDGETLFPYRHLPPHELGQRQFDGAGWFGHGKWCRGTWQPATPTPTRTT